MKLIGWGDVRMTARERPFAAEPSQLRKVLVRVFSPCSIEGFAGGGPLMDAGLTKLWWWRMSMKDVRYRKLTLLLTVVVSQAPMDTNMSRYCRIVI